MIYAAIDIGSNASRLLFANASLINGEIRISKSTLVRIPTRLGLDVYQYKQISDDRKDILYKTLHGFKLLIQAYKPVKTDACATAAMREAENGDEILNYIKNYIGLDVRIIDGLEEARIIQKTNRMDFLDLSKPNLFVDVGGGSTDISISVKDKIIDAHSFEIGTIRLMKNVVKNQEWHDLENWLTKYRLKYGTFNIIGSGGNINKLNKMYGDPVNFIFTRKNLKKALKHLESLSLQEKKSKLGLRQDRADVIVHAGNIFKTVFRTLNAEHIYVPKIGLADGLIYQMYEQHLNQY